MPSPLLAFAMLLWVPLVGSQQSAESALLEWVAAGSTGFDSPVGPALNLSLVYLDCTPVMR
jgi:hypothetical protein